jgi:phosphoribosyl-ATP pyrophosphohydrolase
MASISPLRHEATMTKFTLADLAAIIAARSDTTADKSYTKSLLDAGPARAARKLGEEAVETIIAAIEGEPKALVSESADLLYHLLVVLQARGIGLDEVMAELERRTAQSGHEEKAARKV